MGRGEQEEKWQKTAGQDDCDQFPAIEQSPVPSSVWRKEMIAETGKTGTLRKQVICEIQCLRSGDRSIFEYGQVKSGLGRPAFLAELTELHLNPELKAGQTESLSEIDPFAV